MTTRREFLAGVGAVAAGAAAARPVCSLVGERESLDEAAGWDRSTAKLYIQDGLVALWDGIENVGWGVHDANATVWQDLIRADKSITINGQTWGADCLDFYNSPTIYSAAWTPEFGSAEPLTLETVLSTDAVSNTTSYSIAAMTLGGAPASVLRILYVANIGSSRCDVYWANVRQWTGVASLPVGLVSISTTREVVDGAKFAYKLYVNGELFASANVAQSALPAGLTLGGYYRATNVWPSNTHLKINNIRLSSRALTADEVAYNYKLDKMRFGI